MRKATGFNRQIRKILDTAKSEKRLTQDIIANAIGVTRIILNRAAKRERTLGYQPLTTLLKVTDVSLEEARLTWIEWYKDIFFSSELSVTAKPLLDLALEKSKEKEINAAWLECAREYIKKKGGKPDF